MINAIIGFVQESKAEAALEAIRAMLSPRTTVSEAEAGCNCGNQGDVMFHSISIVIVSGRNAGSAVFIFLYMKRK